MAILCVIESVSQFTVFTDSCSLAWGVYNEEIATWDDFVQFPYEINTRKTLHYLATQLLLNGIVDASDCPAGGLSIGLNWPTACGLERASSEMIEWQNQFDDYIWLASRDHGIPPKILKTLIEVESQFWPGNHAFFSMNMAWAKSINWVWMFCCAEIPPCTKVLLHLSFRLAQHPI